MIPLHSLLTMTPASSPASPADEKPHIGRNSEQPQDYQAQHPTPPEESAQTGNSGQGWNDPFNGNRPLSANGQVDQYAQAANGVSGSGHHQNSYAFTNAYQQGQAGYFNSAQQRPSSFGSSSTNGSVTPVANRVPIPRQGSAADTSTGPMSSNVSLPPRPKPGRKPMVDDNSQDRRRKQNRDAQRSFRDRRQQRLSEAMGQLGDLTEDMREAEARHKVEVDALNQRLAASEAENRKLREEISLIRSTGGFRRDTAADNGLNGLALPPMNRRTGPSPSANGVRPTTEALPMETDFTNYGRIPGAFRAGDAAPSRNEHATSASVESASNGIADDASSPGLAMGIEGKEYSCGFCTDVSNCLCRQNDAEGAEMLVALSESSPQSNKRKRGPKDDERASPAL